MEILQTVIAAVVAIGILVTVHEFGHFWVARRCGVRVLRFSVGFGKALYSWRDRRGTEYVIAAIPLGGYVKMLDEREAEVPASQLHEAFNRKSVSQRIAIVVAGPAVNLLFSVFAYWCMFLYGVSAVAPVIGELVPGSLGATSGLMSNEEITAIDGYPTRTWEDVGLRLAARIGESGVLNIETRSMSLGAPHRYRVDISDWQVDEQRGPIFSLGITPFRPPVPAVIGQVVEGGRAQAAGLQVGDRVEQFNHQPVADWYGLVASIQAHPERSVNLTVLRAGESLLLPVIPAARSADDGKVYGYIGAGVEPPEWPTELLRDISYGPLEAIPFALSKSYQMAVLIVDSIAKMLQGDISVKNLSGPITIAKVAGASAQSGVESFLNFLAYLSISLGILNLLPIPMLDGGHLLYYVIEAVRGRAVSEKTQVVGLKIGMALLMALMFLAFYNDLARL